MRFEQFLNESSRFEVGDFILQKTDSHEIYAKVIEKLKNGGCKVVSFTSEGGSITGKAKMDSTKGWYPTPVSIKEKDIPPKILDKINKKIAEKE
jgi:hypothetical protein